jgi:hypothetical protein
LEVTNVKRTGLAASPIPAALGPEGGLSEGNADSAIDGVGPGVVDPSEVERPKVGDPPPVPPPAEQTIVPLNAKQLAEPAREVVELELGIAVEPDPHGRDLKEIANSLRHKLLHDEKNPHCQVCHMASFSTYRLAVERTS